MTNFKIQFGYILQKYQINNITEKKRKKSEFILN